MTEELPLCQDCGQNPVMLHVSKRKKGQPGKRCKVCVVQELVKLFENLPDDEAAHLAEVAVSYAESEMKRIDLDGS